MTIGLVLAALCVACTPAPQCEAGRCTEAATSEEPGLDEQDDGTSGDDESSDEGDLGAEDGEPSSSDDGEGEEGEGEGEGEGDGDGDGDGHGHGEDAGDGDYAEADDLDTGSDGDNASDGDDGPTPDDEDAGDPDPPHATCERADFRTPPTVPPSTTTWPAEGGLFALAPLEACASAAAPTGTFVRVPLGVPAAPCMLAETSPLGAMEALSSVSAGDIDADGRVDLVLFGWTRPLTVLANRGCLRFEDVTAASGLALAATSAALLADLDNDGDLDLVTAPLDLVTSRALPIIRVFANHGGAFTEVPQPLGLPQRSGMATSLSAFDADEDGLLDLYVARGGWDATLDATDDFLRGKGALTFTDALAASGLAEPPMFTWAASPVRDPSTLRLELVRAHDRAVSYQAPVATADNASHWLSSAPLVPWFSRSPLATPAAMTPMSLSVGYLDDTASPYVFLADFYAMGLWRRAGGGWQDVARDAGVRSTAAVYWGSTLADLDNDADTDILVLAGRTPAAHPAFPRESCQSRVVTEESGPPEVYLNDSRGRFTAAGQALGFLRGERKNYQGLVTADLDADGDLDFVAGGYGEEPALWENRITAGRGWLEVRLSGRRANRQGIGAIVTLRHGERAQRRQVLYHGGPYSHDTAIARFGLGAAPGADELEVRWPSGLVQRASCVPAGQTVVVVEPSEP